MFKKLVLLMVGGLAAAGGFYYYTNLPEEEASALADSLSKQKVNLENMARDIANSETVKKAIDKGREALAESPQVQNWLNDTLQEYAQQQQVSLSEQEAGELVDRLMELRSFSENALQDQAAGQEPYTPEQQQRFEEIMARGDAAFQQYLGVPMNQFLTAMSKSSFKQMLDPQ